MLNNFVFNCKYYLQVKACSIETICVPSSANIFMDYFERKYFYPSLEGLLLSYLKFIDDIFFIWTGSKNQLITFLHDLNTNQNSIKFEYKISPSSISFLDMEVYIKNNKIYTKIYRKQTGKTFCILIQSILYY